MIVKQAQIQKIACEPLPLCISTALLPGEKGPKLYPETLSVWVGGMPLVAWSII